jgi:hypothetical protein
MSDDEPIERMMFVMSEALAAQRRGDADALAMCAKEISDVYQAMPDDHREILDGVMRKTFRDAGMDIAPKSIIAGFLALAKLGRS